jgi:transposase InsO family protein
MATNTPLFLSILSLVGRKLYQFQTKKTTTVIRVMKEYIFARHGIPNYLLSDEGSELLNQLMAEVCKLYGVTKVFSAACHSRRHGMVERLNRAIEDRLKHTTNQACDDWDVWLPEALFAIRSTPASGTKMSPFFAFFTARSDTTNR